MLGSLPANREEMMLSEARSSAEMVLPWTASLLGDENRMTLLTGSKMMSFAGWLSTVTAKPAPVVLVPGVVPINSVEPAEVPPFATGLATVIVATPAEAMSPAEIAACSCVLEMKVVVRDVPFNCTTAAGSKFVPFTVNVNPAPPEIAKLGLTNAICGVDPVGAGVGAGVGSGTGVGGLLGSWLTNGPTRSTSWLPLFHARPFFPQRIRRSGLPAKEGTVMEPAEVNCLRLKTLRVAPSNE